MKQEDGGPGVAARQADLAGLISKARSSQHASALFRPCIRPFASAAWRLFDETEQAGTRSDSRNRARSALTGAVRTGLEEGRRGGDMSLPGLPRLSESGQDGGVDEECQLMMRAASAPRGRPQLVPEMSRVRQLSPCQTEVQGSHTRKKNEENSILH